VVVLCVLKKYVLFYKEATAGDFSRRQKMLRIKQHRLKHKLNRSNAKRLLFPAANRFVRGCVIHALHPQPQQTLEQSIRSQEERGSNRPLFVSKDNIPNSGILPFQRAIFLPLFDPSLSRQDR
jgi:hypothetical protein